MHAPGPALVTLHVWRVPRSAVPQALARTGLDRYALRHTRGLRFVKSLGTGGAGFTVGDATPRTWALLTCWESARDARAFTSSPVVRRWSRSASETARLDLRPLASRGRWSGREPFGDPAPGRHDGPVVALTRARLRARTMVNFWRAVPPVAASLGTAPGLRLTFGIGEAPVGVQGTVSVWDSAASLRAFAYDGAAHREAIRQTPLQNWYAEELFARFALVGAVGSIDGLAL